MQDLNTLKRYELLLLLAEVRMQDYDICRAIDKIDAEELAMDYLKLIEEE
jgi:hypothetical protein